MIDGAETIVVERWLYETFAADTGAGGLMELLPDGTGGLWDGPASETASYPLVRWGNQSMPLVVRGVGTTEVMLNGLWLVRGITQGASYDPVVPIAQRIHALIHAKLNVVTSSGSIDVCVREEVFRLPQVEGGREYRHLGGMYRIIQS